MKNVTLLLISLMLVDCNSSHSQDHSKPSGKFNGYWYGGKAEISSFELKQARYGEIHSGEAVLVFVTEPFSKSKQVKLDDWRNTTSDNVSVLKLNFTKKFLTGIYPYSMMSSTFTPVKYNEHSQLIKVTTSSQEWCGHTFTQLNFGKDNYKLKSYSYFESEGDLEIEIPKTILEDELWTRIRLNPDQLPIGRISLLPGTFYLRLRHQEARAQPADAKIEELASSDFSDEGHKRYTLKYANRTLKIYFESDFPYGILGWEETHLSGFGKPEALTTTAKRINTIQSAYWNQNSNEDRKIRKELGLGVD
ncbi:MAG: hypothetical protein ABJE80_07440 [Reichenbachiella sp.]|uniref:hypothetical protein n=1 Tax=Reichenbachiella sp. TaxID=2184521 RepID=UPI00326758AB